MAVVNWITGGTRAALMSGLLVLGCSAAVYPRYVGLNDPQWLGHGIMLLGLLAFLASKQRGWLFLLSAGLMLRRWIRVRVFAALTLRNPVRGD